MTNAACLRAGEILAGKFCVERIIATGGAGVVVAARHLQLGETVALKFLISQPDRDATDLARFVREAQSAVKLKNEHVARVLDVGSLEDGSPYMVMEYLEGSDLDKMLRQRGPLSITDAVDYVLQACEAIAEAHHLGIVHRDIKPSNFFLTRRNDGSPLIKVLDFGIAKARDDLQQDLSLTKTRTVLGSPVYMSPEQIRSARSVDHRTDIWSLGVTLYELLTDQLPFDGDSITGVAAAVSADPIAPIRDLRAEIPVGLSTIIETCLEKKPGDRYQSVAEFAAALVPYGPETARYSLKRIRGALNMKTRDSQDEVATTLVANNGVELIDDSSAIQESGSATPSSQRKKPSRHWVLSLAALLLVVVGLAAFYGLRSPAAGLLEPRSTQASIPVKAAGPLPLPSNSKSTAESPEPTPVQPISSLESQVPTVPAPAHVAPISVGSIRRTVAAQPPVPGGHSKSTTEKSSSAKDAQNPTRYEAISDTRK